MDGSGRSTEGGEANKALQADWSSAQGQGFELRVLEQITPCTNPALEAAEDRWIAEFRATDPGVYNVRQAAIGRCRTDAQDPGRRGWIWLMGWKKAHYFVRGGRSLCGRAPQPWGMFLEDDNHGSPANCLKCNERRQRRERPDAR